jgi:hypothetical protein
MTQGRRQPVRSLALTHPLAARVPVRWQPFTISLIRVVHTAIFVSVATLIGVFAWDGLRGRPGRRAAISGAVAVGEAAIYASNNQVCPLTPLAEELGAASGEVADILLPGWLSRRVPLISGTALIIGIVLNGRTWLDGRPARAEWPGTSVRWTLLGSLGRRHAQSRNEAPT